MQKLVESLAQLKIDRFIALTGGPKTDQKLTAKDFTLKIDLVLDDGKIITLTAGAAFDRFGHFAQISTWPDAVFLLNSSRVEPFLSGAGYWVKDKVAFGS